LNYRFLAETEALAHRSTSGAPILSVPTDARSDAVEDQRIGAGPALDHIAAVTGIPDKRIVAVGSLT
jgi:hypothetical protein